MEKASKIKQLLAQFNAKPNTLITAQVVSIEDTFCTVKLAEGLEVSGVRLLATNGNGDNGFKIVPKVGTDVLVLSQSTGVDNLVVIKIDEWDKISFKQNDFEFILDAETKKATLKKTGANLGQSLSQLTQALQNAQIITPAGPGTFDPATIATLVTVQTALENLLTTN